MSVSQSVSSVAQSCPTLCDPMNCSTPGFLVHHQLPELAQIYVHQVSDAIQFHPLSSPSPPPLIFPSIRGSFPMRQFFTSGGQSIEVSASASLLPMNTQDQFPLGLTGLISLQSKGLSRGFYPAPQFKSINFSVFSLFYGPTLTSIHDNWKNHSFNHTDLGQQSDASDF